MPVPASATSVGAGKTASPKSGPTTRQRETVSSSRSKRAPGSGAGNSGLWKFYSEDSPGVKVGPVPIMVASLTFIAAVFLLHIWGKYTRL